MKRSNRRLFTIMFLLVISIALLASSTYAWFSSNKVVEVSGVSVRVSALNKLEVSADGRDFSSSITLSDILNADYSVDKYNSLPTVFEPVSTVGNIENGMLDMYYGTVTIDADETSDTFGETALRAKKVLDVDGSTGKYMAFDMYFKNPVARSLYVSNKSTVSYQGGAEGIKNAMRLAFVFEGSTESLDINDIQSMTTDDTANVMIWEPNSDTHTDTGVDAAFNYYGLMINNVNDPLLYYGIKAPIETPVPIDSRDPDYFAMPENLFVTLSTWRTASSHNQFLFDFPAGIAKVRIYAWVEGQDVDCENMASGSTFDFNLIFTTNPDASTK